MDNRFTKISAEGLLLPADASEFVAVADETSGLIWDAGENKRMTWKDALNYPKTLTVGGFKDWRLPTVEELFCLAARTKFNPAIDTAFFPDCKSDWYWTSTPWASSPGDVAWDVSFDDGTSYCSGQAYRGLVRAVRSRQ